MNGWCETCRKEVTDEGGFHTAPGHDPTCDGTCKYCPVPVQCGPVVRDVCDHPEVVPTGDGYGVCTSCGDNTFPIDSEEACDG